MKRDGFLPAALVLGALASTSCAGSEAKVQTAGKDHRAAGIAKDDASRCDYAGRTDREVQETSGPGAIQPNIRRVYGIVGEGERRRRVLLCREVDTNLDGSKDVVRTYQDDGEKRNEMADVDYDGKIDTWITFEAGRIAQVELDKNNDGKPDETRSYIQGRLTRISRDTNGDAKPDVWEVYSKGRLQRMGVDVDHDGRVDRWNRDEQLVEQEEQEAAEERGSDAGAPPSPSQSAADAGASDAEAGKQDR